MSSPQIMTALKKVAKSGDLSINELRVVVALERAIARLEAHSRLSSHIVFKGGFVLLKTLDTTRFTRDVDAIAIGIQREEIPKLVTEALSQDLNDGLWYGDIQTEDLVDQGSYGGYRMKCAFQIGTPSEEKIVKLSRIHIDIGFGDPVEAVPKKEQMPSLLPGGEPVSWSIYPLEFIFAEKLETLFIRGSANSRAKDVYDIPIIFSKCTDKKKLLEAVIKTFKHRGTPIPDSFEQKARSFDLTVLRSAWQSVTFAQERDSFDDSWQKLLRCIHSLDKARSL